MIKKIALISFVSIVVALLFLGYMYFIGIPKTQARNFYNLALQDEEKGDKVKALKDLKTAKGYWDEIYIEQEIKELDHQK